MHPNPLADYLLAERNRGEREHAALPLNRWLYRTVRSAILSGALTAETQLPSTRDLARELGMSRNTVLSAISQLTAEGYLVARQGSGTYVSPSLPDLRPSSLTRGAVLGTRRRNLSRRGSHLTSDSGAAKFEVQPFSPGEIEYAEFPLQTWHKLQSKYWRSNDRTLLDYGQQGGHLPLRCAIAEYLSLSRSVKVTPERVFITSGTQQSIDLAARLLTDHGDEAWVENPCYWGAKRALLAAGLHLRPIPVDTEGMSPGPADLERSPRLIYVTPSHQYPLGHVMSLNRRRALLDFAARRRCWIFEDDYDSEFRYTGRPFASLQGLDAHAQVLYSGTFSKVMYPGIRLGYLVVPADLAASFDTALYDLYRPGQLMLQAALTDFITEGHFATLIRRLRVAYCRRRDILARRIQATFGDRLVISGHESGLHLCLVFSGPCAEVDDEALAAICAARGMSVRPLSRYYIGEASQRGLIVGYAYVPDARIGPWAKVLCELLARHLG